ncbi:MAG TPA: hypothetical protein VMA95_18550 [Streptosporangiaceae bacterium]|nr:hypothetical protein [Streptosporangiaceae bacterium]
MEDEPRPPDWAVDGADRLDPGGFGRAFAECWQSSPSGMDKVEAWQTYDEPGAGSLRAFEAGDYPAFSALAEAETEAEGFVYDDLRLRGKSLRRQRVVRLPLSPYLEWEFWQYRIRTRLGEVVEIIDAGDSQLSSYFDCLLFGASVALVQDYRAGGQLAGGWLVTGRPALAGIADLVAGLRVRSVPLETFIAERRIKLPGEGKIRAI